MAGDIYPTVTYGPHELMKDAITSFDVAQIKWQDGLHVPYAVSSILSFKALNPIVVL